MTAATVPAVEDRPGQLPATSRADVGSDRRTLLLDRVTASGVVTTLLGLALVVLGWLGAAADPAPTSQLAYAVSGGLAGLAVLGIGCGLLMIQADRWAAAVVAREHARLAREWVALTAVVRARQETPS